MSAPHGGASDAEPAKTGQNSDISDISQGYVAPSHDDAGPDDPFSADAAGAELEVKGNSAAKSEQDTEPLNVPATELEAELGDGAAAVPADAQPMSQVATLFDNFDDDSVPEPGENQRIKDMAMLQDGFTDALINLYMDMNTLLLHHWSYWIIQWLIPLLHLLCLMFSPFAISLWLDDDSSSSFVRTLATVMSFSPKSRSAEPDVAGSTALALLYLVFLGVFGGSCAVFLKMKQYPKVLVYINAAIVHCFVPALLLCFSTELAFFFFHVKANFTAGWGILAILDLIILVGTLAFFRLTSYMNGFLVHPSPSPVASYRGEHPALTVIGASLYIVVGSLTAFYTEWLLGVVMLLHAAFLGYQLFDVFQFPFVRPMAHPLAAAIYTGTIVGHFLNAVRAFGLSVPGLVRLLVPIIFFVVGFVVFHFSFRLMAQKVIDILSNKDAPAEAQRRTYYEGLKDLENRRNVQRMVRIAMTHFPSMLMDFTFLVYCAEQSEGVDDLLDSALFVSFFPMEFQVVEFFLEAIAEHTLSTYRDRFAIHRIWQLLRRRASSNTGDTAVLFDHAQELTLQFLGAIRSFWNRVAGAPTSIEISHIEELERLRREAKRAWQVGIARHRGDPRFSLGYSDFLLEGVMDIEEGVIERLKSAQLQTGATSQVDDAFRSFAIARPELIRNQICDKRGNIKKVAFELGQTTTTTMTGMLYENIEADIAAGAADKTIEELFQWPHLRQSISRATVDYRPPGATCGSYSIALAILLFIVLFIVVAVRLAPLLSMAPTFADQFLAISAVQHGIINGFQIFEFDWADRMDVFFKDLDKVLPPAALEERLEVPWEDFNSQMRHSTVEIGKLFMDMTRIFSDYMAEATNTSRFVDVFVGTHVQQPMCMLLVPGFAPVAVMSLPISIKNAVLRYLLTIPQIASLPRPKFLPPDDPFESYTHPVLAMMKSVDFCQFLPLVHSFPKGFTVCYDLTINQFTDQVESDAVIVRIFLYITIFGMVFVIIPMLDAMIFVHFFGLKEILKAICSLPSQVAQDAAHPVCKSTNVEQVMASPGSDESDSSLPLIIIAHLACSLIMVIGFVVICVVMLNHNQSMNDYLYWIVLGVRRFNACGAALIQIGACILLPYAGQYVSLVYGEVAAYEGGTDYQWILANQLSNSKKQAKEFQQLSSAFFSGSDERPGVKGLLPELDDLHLRESCDVGSVTGDLRHDLYSCFGIQGLISTMDSFVREIAINSENDPSVNTLFSSSLHINLAHLVLAEMSDHLTRANYMVVDALHSRTNMTRAVVIILLVCIALVFLFHLWLLHRTVKRLKRLCKTGMVMIRRVSPSAIINSEEITLLILGHKATEKEIESSPAFVTFECLPRATLVVSTDETIEDINMKARELLAFTRRQIIGQKIDTVIHRPSTVESADKSQGERSGEGSVGERSTGERNVGERSLVGDIAEGAVEAIRARQLFEAFARMRRAGCEHWKASTIVDCHRADDEVVSCVVDLQGIPDVTGQVDGFLLFMSDTSAESKMAAQVHEAKERVARLKNQLIPSDVQGFIHGDRTDFSFVTKTVCVVTVQVSTFTAHMKHIGTVPFLEQLRDFFGRVAVLCAQQPQLMKQSEFVDTFIAAGGLFSADDPAVYAHAAVTFAKNVLEFVERKVPKEGEAEFRVQIGIALGGPLLCGLTGLEEKSFVAAGTIIEEALSLAEVAPPNKIIVSLAVKAAIQEEDFEPGPALIDGAPSFFLKFAQAPKPPPRKPGSTARSPTFNDAGPLPMDGEASAPVAPQEPSPSASQFELSGRIDANCSPSEPPS